jgi:hypothetical protein
MSWAMACGSSHHEVTPTSGHPALLLDSLEVWTEGRHLAPEIDNDGRHQVHTGWYESTTTPLPKVFVPTSEGVAWNRLLGVTGFP